MSSRTLSEKNHEGISGLSGGSVGCGKGGVGDGVGLGVGGISDIFHASNILILCLNRQ